jgi:hypothetical protein
MSSIMRWRNGETEGVNELMVRLQSKGEADCLSRQLGKNQKPCEQPRRWRGNCRASGLVHR